MSTDTPRVHAILTSLLDIRKRLRSIKSKNDQKLCTSDIPVLHEQVEAQAIALCQARDAGALGPETNSKVDAVLDDVYHILSLYRKTPKEAPATVYVQLTTMKQCLDHLESSGIFRLKDLEPYEARLTDLEKMVQTEFPTDDEGRPQHGQQLLIARKLEQCRSIVDAIRDSLKSISPHLIPIQNKLIALKRQLETIAAQRSIRPSDLHPVQDELRKIDTARVDGIWRASDGSVPAGQSHIRGLMEQLYDETHDLLTRSDTLTDKTLRPIYENLIEIKSRLQYLSLTHRWTMREDDIYYYQAQLQKVDLQRQDGKFHAEDGSVPQGQAVLNSLLNKSYNLVHVLLSSVSPVAEPLIAVHNQLLTIRKCLTEVTRYGGPYTAMEVYPFQMKLASIDNMRRDGKFFDDEGNVPEGQGIVHALLSECYDYVYAIRAQIEDET